MEYTESSFTNVAVLEDEEEFVSGILSGFRNIDKLSPTDRTPDFELIHDAITFSKDTSYSFQVINVLTVYRLLLESGRGLSFAQKKKFNKAIREIESSLRNFLNNGVLLAIDVKVSEIFE